MSKISTYPSADTPLQLSDRLIGTEAIRPVPSPTPLATKNFSLGELLQLFSSNFPAASLQAVLNTGNIATQNITLIGTIDATLIKPDNIEDTSGSQGLTFQFLSKGTSSINWVDLPVSNLQEVLDKGNIAEGDINLDGNITSYLIKPLNIQDEKPSIGSLGQVLTKSATGIVWADSTTSSTPGLADVLSVGNVAATQILLNDGTYESVIGFDGGIYNRNIGSNIYVGIGSDIGLGFLYNGFDVSLFVSDIPTHNIQFYLPVSKAGAAYTLATTDDIPIVGDYVPYTGATEDVNLGVNDLTAQHLIKNGGVSTQFLKADGSVDNNIYLTSNDLPSTLDLFATTTPDALIPSYSVLVRNILDPRYDDVAVNVSTGAITTTNQLLSSLITDANVISGNPGVFNFTTIGNIRRVSGSGEAVFYFRIYKRDSSGVETFITQSDNTIPVIDGGTYVEFSAVALWNDGTFLSTDRIVLKYYANRISGGSNPTYEFQFGGITPVRSTAAVPVAVLPNIYLSNLVDVEDVPPLPNEVLYWNETANLWEHSSVLDLMPEATSVDDGYLSATDWSTFNDKANANTELNIRRTGYTVYNEFLSSLTNGSYAQGVISAGTIVSAAGDVDLNHFGVVGYRSSTAPNSGYYSALNPSAAVHFSCTLVANLQTDLIFKTAPTISPATTIRFGIGSGSISATEYANGFYFEIIGNSLVGKTANVSVRSSTASYTVLDDTWYHLRIIATSITLITYYVYDMDGTLLFSATLNTTLPSTTIVMNNSVISTNGGTSATILIYLDLISITFPSMVRGALN